MSSRQRPTIGGLHLRDDHPSQVLHNTIERPTDIYYFGGQPGNIPGLVDPTEVFLNEDGSGVVFARDPNLAAPRIPYQGMLGQAKSGVNEANVALGFDWGPEQQSALPPVSPVSPSSPYSPGTVTTVSAAPAERSTDSVSREGDAVGSSSPRGEQEQRPSTQSQPASSQGFTAVNRTQRNGSIPINPRAQPRNAPAPEAPSRKRKAPTQKSKAQETKPRTNSRKERAPQGALTRACGVVTPLKATPVAKVNNNGGFCCPRCKGHFTRPKSVKDHFAKCVAKHGNPSGLRWFDDGTLVKSRNHYENRMTTIRDASEDEEEEEDAEDAEDAEDDGDQEQAYEEEDFSDAYREGYGDGPERDHGEGDEESIFEEDWESAPGEDDQGIRTRESAASSPLHRTIEEPQFFLRSDDYELTAGPSTEGGFVTCPTPGYGPGGYKTPEQTSYRRQWTPTPPYDGRSYTPGVGVGYETPSQQHPYGQDHDGDSVMDD